MLDIELDPSKFYPKYTKGIIASNQAMKKMIEVFSLHFRKLENKQLKEAHEVAGAVTTIMVADITKIETRII